MFFCILAAGLSRALAGMFFIISCRMLANCEPAMSTIITTQTIFTLNAEGAETATPCTRVTVWLKVADRGAPKMVEAFAWAATSGVRGPIGFVLPVAMVAMLARTR